MQSPLPPTQAIWTAFYPYLVTNLAYSQPFSFFPFLKFHPFIISTASRPSDTLAASSLLVFHLYLLPPCMDHLYPKSAHLYLSAPQTIYMTLGGFWIPFYVNCHFVLHIFPLHFLLALHFFPFTACLVQLDSHWTYLIDTHHALFFYFLIFSIIFVIHGPSSLVPLPLLLAAIS